MNSEDTLVNTDMTLLGINKMLKQIRTSDVPDAIYTSEYYLLIFRSSSPL